MTPREQLTQALETLEAEHGMKNIIETLSDMAYGRSVRSAPNRSLRHCWDMVQERLWDVRDMLESFLGKP